MGGPVTVTFLGHAGLSVESTAFRLVCDPWFDRAGANLGSWYQYPATTTWIWSRYGRLTG